MKSAKILVLLLIALVLAGALFSCGLHDAEISLNVTVSVMDSEQNFSGILFADPAYFYPLGAPTIDGVLRQLTEERKIAYFYDGSFISIDAFAFYDSPDNAYSRAWAITLNGKTPENGVFAAIAEGDVIELKYILFVHP